MFLSPLFPRLRCRLPAWAAFLAVSTVGGAQPLANDRYSLEPTTNGAVRLTTKDGSEWTFQGDFVVLVSTRDPKPAMRPGNIPRVSYNVLSWQAQAPAGGKALPAKKRAAAQAGDGFDDRILEGDTAQRTADVFAAAPVVRLRAASVVRAGKVLRFTYPAQAAFELSAEVSLPIGDVEPVLTYTLTPRQAAWFSVGYTGSPAHPLAELAEVWQPFIWQGKRFPAQSIVTPAFECSLPATFMRKGSTTLGVIADADEFPFQPLPLLENSRFGVALRNAAGQAQPMVFAPLLGGGGIKTGGGAGLHVQAATLRWCGRYHERLRSPRAPSLRVPRLSSQRDRFAQ